MNTIFVFQSTLEPKVCACALKKNETGGHNGDRNNRESDQGRKKTSYQ